MVYSPSFQNSAVEESRLRLSLSLPLSLSHTHKHTHTQTHTKKNLLKSTSLTAHDYKPLGVIPLKLKLEFNKGIIMHKIVSGYVPSNLKLNFHSNQYRHSHKLVVPRPRLDLFKCSLMYSGENLWNNLPLSIKILSGHKAFKKNI